MSWSPSQSVAIAKSHVGYHEGRNNDNIFTRWQTGFTSTQPWCDSFCSYCAWHAGYRFPYYSLFGEKGDWNVGAHHEHARRQGIWRDPWNYVAQAGDLVVLNFVEGGILIRDAHIETVVYDLGPGPHFPRVTTIGGNTGDQVAWRSRYPVNVYGFIALTLDQQPTPPGPGPTPRPQPEPLPQPRRHPLTTIAQPGRTKKGRQGTARPVPEVGAIALDNGASLHGDQRSGNGRVWVSQDKAVVASGRKLIDITSPLGPDHLPDGTGVIALFDLGGGDVGTYKIPWS